jgi:hypothetical protein
MRTYSDGRLKGLAALREARAEPRLLQAALGADHPNELGHRAIAAHLAAVAPGCFR